MSKKRVDYVRVHLAASSLTSVYFDILTNAYIGMGEPRELVYTKHKRELRAAGICDRKVLKAQSQKNTIGIRLSVCLDTIDLVDEMLGNWHYEVSDGVLTLTDKVA